MKIKINPIFIIVVLLAYVLGEVQTILLFFSILFIHDFSHFLVARYYEVHIASLEIMPFGCEMKIDDGDIDDIQKLYIYMAGPLTNISIALILLILKYFDIYYSPLYNEILFANLCIGFFNLLPLHPLDGSILFRVFLSKVVGTIKASKVIVMMTQITASFLIVITIYSLIHKVYNVNYGIIGVFLLIHSIKERRNILMRAMQNEIIKRRKILATNRYLKSERICVNVNASLKKIMSYFNANRYYIIEVIDSEHNYITTITEEDIIEGIINLGYDCTILDILV
ncbi:hypothetical protein GC105_12445 [Alkalibaculum sp. M08DMB]|uniref:Peptidase M50 domain-containing protein n=1 Tax=Alkalibaculum sporogenes TaxID=2655001 RepID=A0A6A7KAP8_9FIRM|nr:site-2 protease family protein [Alkalibaculum sporogenes]MPW26598.1 hypothetical protein [Alkalibaculum sporogenes]